ncbi:hypothetical protein ACRPOS_007640 [Bartonella heixiaziensis]|uniref:hypothetical protein n=1 Tax=Bartonella heixiaziensis TaxID=1461000 RepID=UPI003908B612
MNGLNAQAVATLELVDYHDCASLSLHNGHDGGVSGILHDIFTGIVVGWVWERWEIFLASECVNEPCNRVVLRGLTVVRKGCDPFGGVR